MNLKPYPEPNSGETRLERLSNVRLELETLIENLFTLARSKGLYIDPDSILDNVIGTIDYEDPVFLEGVIGKLYLIARWSVFEPNGVSLSEVPGMLPPSIDPGKAL